MRLKSDADKADLFTHTEEPPASTETGRQQRAMRIAKAIDAIEGVPTSEYAAGLAERWVKGESPDEQMKQLLSEHHWKIAAFTKEQNENKKRAVSLQLTALKGTSNGTTH